MENKNKHLALLEYMFIGMLVLVIAYYVLGFADWDMRTPLKLSGDATGSLLLVRSYLRNKHMFQVDQYLTYPYYRNVSEISYDGFLINILYYILAKVTRDIGLTINLTYLLTYVLSAIVTYFSMQQLKISKKSSFVGAILYAFIPGHAFRHVAHIYLGSAWVMPLTALFPFFLLNGDLHSNKKTSAANVNAGMIKKYIDTLDKRVVLISIVGLVGVCLSSLYYAFFFLILIAGLGVICFVVKRDKYCLLDAVNVCLLMIVVLLFLVEICVNRYGNNLVETVQSSRSVENINVYCLKLATLILPVMNHRVPMLANFRDMYMSSYGQAFNENEWASLGFFLSVALVYGVFALLAGTKTQINKGILVCSRINVFLILLASCGGVSTLVGLLFSSIRCYNRVSFIIGIYSTFILGLLLDRLNISNAQTGGKKMLSLVLCILIVIIGVFDQIPYQNAKETSGERTAEYVALNTFVNQIEAFDDIKNVAIYPCGSSWENTGYKNNSLMAMANRVNFTDAAWIRRMDSLPESLRLDCLAIEGVDAVIVGDFYSDYEAKKKVFSEELGEPILRYNDGEWEVYSLRKVKNRIKTHYSENEKVNIKSWIEQQNMWCFYNEEYSLAAADDIGRRFFEKGLTGTSDETFTWIEGEEAYINVRLWPSEISGEKSQVKIAIDNILRGNQRVIVYEEDNVVFDEVLTDDKEISFVINSKDGEIRLRMVLPDAISPQELGVSDDGRKLSIGISNITFYKK